MGKTVRYTEPAAAAPSIQYDALGELVDDMQAGRVELLCVLDGNPAYASPAELDFAKALAKVPFRVRLGLYEDETSALCDWHVPLAHFLESWSDARAADGAVCIAQPLIAPLYQGKTACEILAVLLDEPGKSAHAIVKEYWQTIRTADGDFEAFWQTSLHNGVMPDTRSADVSVTVDLSKLSTPPDGRAAETAPAKVPAERGRSTLFSAPIRRSGTDALPTMAGCRSCRSRSRS